MAPCRAARSPSVRNEWLQTLVNLRTDPARLERFTEAVAEIGAKALASCGDKDRDSDWIEGKKLGYGNEALLVTSTFNTPTATLTALWTDRPGVWHSLLPRRPKR